MAVPAKGHAVPDAGAGATAADQLVPRVLITCQYYPPAVRAGGAPRSIAAIVAEESIRTSIEILTRNADLGTGQPFTTAETEAVDHVLPPASIRRCPSGRAWIAIWRRLRQPADFDILYLNSMFSPWFTLWPLLLMATGLVPRRQILLAPRGELGTGALAIKPHRKRLVGRLIRPLLARLDLTWHASTADEADSVTRFLGRRMQPVFVRNDPAMPPALPSAPENACLTVCFVARMVPIKNFQFLVRAALTLTEPTTIVVAGAIEDQDYWERCRELIDKLPGHVSVHVMGHIEPADVIEVLRRSDAMVLPTLGENFGHAIAEALSVGCPVFIPDTTPWTALMSDGCGWVIDLDDPAGLRRALDHLAAEPRSTRNTARRTVAHRYAQWWAANQVHDRSLFTAAFDRSATSARPDDAGTVPGLAATHRPRGFESGGRPGGEIRGCV